MRKFDGNLEDVKRSLEGKNLVFKNLIFQYSYVKSPCTFSAHFQLCGKDLSIYDCYFAFPLPDCVVYQMERSRSQEHAELVVKSINHFALR